MRNEADFRVLQPRNDGMRGLYKSLFGRKSEPFLFWIHCEYLSIN